MGSPGPGASPRTPASAGSSVTSHAAVSTAPPRPPGPSPALLVEFQRHVPWCPSAAPEKCPACAVGHDCSFQTICWLLEVLVRAPIGRGLVWLGLFPWQSQLGVGSRRAAVISFKRKATHAFSAWVSSPTRVLPECCLRAGAPGVRFSEGPPQSGQRGQGVLGEKAHV